MDTSEGAPPSGDDHRAYYRAYGMPRWALLAGGALFATVAVGGLVTILVGHLSGDPLVDLGFFVWCIAALLLCAFYLGPTALELTLVDDELLWQSPLLTGRIDLTELRAVRPFGPYGVLAIISAAGRPPVLTWATAGFADFMDHVTAAAPHVHVRHGIYQRTGDWLNGQRWRPKHPPSSGTK